jgi:hypothetical protein
MGTLHIVFGGRICSVFIHFHIKGMMLEKEKKLHIQWGLGSRTPLFTNNSVHEQIFRAKNVSDDERFLGLRTRKLAIAAS